MYNPTIKQLGMKENIENPRPDDKDQEHYISKQLTVQGVKTATYTAETCRSGCSSSRVKLSSLLSDGLDAGSCKISAIKTSRLITSLIFELF